MVRGRRRLFIAAGAALGLCAGLGLLEVALRLTGHLPALTIVGATPEVDLWVRDARLGFRARPGSRIDFARAGSVVTTGPDGERVTHGDSARARLELPIVLFVGDSTTFCGEVDDGRTGPSELARLLPGVCVINAGVRGYGTLQTARNTEDWLARVPARVVVYTFCDNDYIENVFPHLHRPARAPIGRLQDGALVIDEVPASCGPWGAPVAAAGPVAATWSREWCLQGLEGRSALVTRLAEVALGRRVDDPARWQEAGRWADANGGELALRTFLAQLAAACTARGAALIVTAFSTHDALADHPALPLERLVTLCRDQGLTFVDLDPTFTDAPASYRALLRTGITDPHWGEKGTTTFAAAISTAIEAALLR